MIPKTLHFCFGLTSDFGGKPWSLVHHACVRSAIERIDPWEVFFYFQHEPSGPWWELTSQLVNRRRVVAPESVFGRPLLHPAHRADVLRLERLIEAGGIYLDCDVLVHADVSDLLNNSVVLGREQGPDRAGLCNAVIMAEREAPFLRRWHAEYRSFRSNGSDEYWNEHSVIVPLRLATEHPGEVTVLPPAAFFEPNWSDEGIAALFGTGRSPDARGIYANHLWEGVAWRRHLDGLTPGRVREVDSPFHAWLRPLVAGLPDDYGAKSRLTRLGDNAGRVRRRVRKALTHLRT